LRRFTDVAIGEEFSSKWQFQPYIERDIHQFNRLDVCNVGGNEAGLHRRDHPFFGGGSQLLLA
jgi:L-alanine-DL-glutamate epimerase-like enolase superfamily enzyme